MIEDPVANLKNQRLERIKRGLLFLQKKNPEAIKNAFVADSVWMLNELETVQQINILLRARIESLKKLIKS